MEPMASAVPPTSPINIVFVCLGNICRSPALAAVFQKLVEERGLSEKFYIDSCGVEDTFLGAPADQRMRLAAKKRGIALNHKAQLFEDSFFAVFDYIFVVNKEVLQLLSSRAPSPEMRAKIHLATHYSSRYRDQEIPDPYYGDADAFDHTLEIAEDSARGLLAHFISSSSC